MTHTSQSSPTTRSSRPGALTRGVATVTIALSILLGSVAPATAISDGDTVAGPGDALCRFFPIYCPPR